MAMMQSTGSIKSNIKSKIDSKKMSGTAENYSVSQIKNATQENFKNS